MSLRGEQVEQFVTAPATVNGVEGASYRSNVKLTSVELLQSTSTVTESPGDRLSPHGFQTVPAPPVSTPSCEASRSVAGPSAVSSATGSEWAAEIGAVNVV